MKINNSKRALARNEMRAVTSGYLHCGFGGYVCPPGCNDQYQDQFTCSHQQCILIMCPL